MVVLKVWDFASAPNPGQASNGSLLRAESELRWIQRRACFRYPEVGEWNGATRKSLFWLQLHSMLFLHLIKEQMTKFFRLAAKWKFLYLHPLQSRPTTQFPSPHCPLSAERSQIQTNTPTTRDTELYRLKPCWLICEYKWWDYLVALFQIPLSSCCVSFAHLFLSLLL